MVHIHPKGFLVFGIFAVALSAARSPEAAAVAVIATVFIEACLLWGIAGGGVDRTGESRR
jgi:hypothetical protein